MHEMLPALRYAFRSLRRNPGFTITSVLTLALGIAASSLIYCVVRGTLLRTLPFADPDRVVALWEHHPLLGKQEIAAPDFRDWRDQNQTFEHIAASPSRRFARSRPSIFSPWEFRSRRAAIFAIPTRIR